MTAATNRSIVPLMAVIPHRSPIWSLFCDEARLKPARFEDLGARGDVRPIDPGAQQWLQGDSISEGGP